MLLAGKSRYLNYPRDRDDAAVYLFRTEAKKWFKQIKYRSNTNDDYDKDTCSDIKNWCEG